MTEPVARTTPVRRTVRLAMALVAGQAALCAVIGWVTFGPSHDHPQSTDSVDPVAAAPVVIPTASMRLPVASPAPTPGAERTKASPSPKPSFRAPKAPPPAPPAEQDEPEPAPPAEEESPSTVVAPEPPASTRPAPDPDVASGTPTPTPSMTTQGPVVVGTTCEPEGGPGLTADDVPVFCRRGDDGVLRWQIN